MSSLDVVLQRALSTRLNLQISLSQLPIVEEWMDIHLDRWLEHNPMPPEMPDGGMPTYLAMFGSDLQRVWWGAWGDPRGFVPKMADYFKLCNIAKSDAALLDQIGEQLEPEQVGSWIGVWGGKVVTGWHFWDGRPWPKIEVMFGTHEAKFQLKRIVDDNHIERIERFTQSIGDRPFSEVELAIGDAAAVDRAFTTLTGAPLPPAMLERLTGLVPGSLSLAVRIRGGQVARVSVLAAGLGFDDVEPLANTAKTTVDHRLAKLVGAFGGRILRLEYGRAGDHGGIDVYVDPSATGDTPEPTPQAN